ncbi:hypothetical protein E2C01_096963 [Portunus trituberculatus]|uniref:Uncharacterized protein n=1 Tax=Portunus trituberculatus TaxID=210409 RepID=A0A5B7K3D2_PORTR|nr:hypothetical protein [Portunus trituberculatus]
MHHPSGTPAGQAFSCPAGRELEANGSGTGASWPLSERHQSVLTIVPDVNCPSGPLPFSQEVLDRQLRLFLRPD